MMMVTAAFEPLPLRRRSFVAVSAEEYRIVSGGGEIREVKAASAYEAFKLSGFSEAIKIERKAITRQAIFPKNRFADEPVPGMTAEGEQRRKRPVVSASDLDNMIQTLQNEQNSQSRVPQSEEQPMQEVTSPTGMEVHGDGFDELIPAKLSPEQMGEVKLSNEDLIELPPEELVAAAPAAPAPKAAAPQAAPQAVMPQSAPAAPEAPKVTPQAAQSQQERPPEQELTQDEINKLLNG